MEKRLPSSFQFTQEYSGGRQKHGKHLNVVMLDCICSTVGCSPLLFIQYRVAVASRLAKQDCEQKVTGLNFSGCRKGANNLLPPTTN